MTGSGGLSGVPVRVLRGPSGQQPSLRPDGASLLGDPALGGEPDHRSLGMADSCPLPAGITRGSDGAFASEGSVQKSVHGPIYRHRCRSTEHFDVRKCSVVGGEQLGGFEGPDGHRYAGALGGRLCQVADRRERRLRRGLLPVAPFQRLGIRLQAAGGVVKHE